MSPDNQANYFWSTYEGSSILNSSMFYAMSNCKDSGRRIMQNVGKNDLSSMLRSYRKGGMHMSLRTTKFTHSDL